MTPTGPPLDFNGPVGRPFHPFPPESAGITVFERFKEVAEAHPDREAIRCGDGRTTYGELMGRVLAIGWELAKDGEGSPVALALPTDAWYPAAMLGALAAGRPYVPLDLSHPPERLRHILAHSGVTRVLMAGAGPRESEGFLGDGRRLTGVDGLAAASDEWRPAPKVEDPAYILYTSGSTGRPKGVYQHQGGLMHDVMQYTHSVHLSNEDTTTLLYSPSVNGAIRDIFGALLNGACLCMSNLRVDGLRVAWERMAEAGVTIFHAMPPVLRSLLQSRPDAPLPGSVRLAYVAGDRFHAGDVRLLRAAMPREALLYTGIGSTECATLYRQWFMPPDWVPEVEGVPVGHAIPDRELILLDDDELPAEVGQAGSIHVRSRFLARGYWNDPELTAAAFSEAGADGFRTFRTGDCGRLRPDGLLEFRGRADRQVKVRGFRVEPAEVESALRLLPGVGDACVCVVEDGDQTRLVAVAEASPGKRLEPDNLLAALLGRLPSHMIPHRVLVVPSLPRLANFKLDMVRLRGIAAGAVEVADPVQGQAAGVGEGTADANALVKIVAEEWTGVLRRGPASPDQRWDHAGGDSLQALGLMMALERRLERRLPSALVTAWATPRSIANALGMARSDADFAWAVNGRRVRGRLFVVGSATGLTVNDRALAERLSQIIEVELMPSTSLEEELERVHSIETLARRHAAAITRMTGPGEPIYLLGLSFGGRVAFELGCQLVALGYRVPFVAITDIRPGSGYNVLSRCAWLAWCQEVAGGPVWERLRRRTRAEARMAVSRCIQFIAGRGWVTLLRFTVRSGLVCFGQSFASGAKAAISQSQIPAWRPPSFSGEVLLSVTGETARLFSRLPSTLGWEAHAARVRAIRIEGSHGTYNNPPYAASFADRMCEEVLRAASRA